MLRRIIFIMILCHLVSGTLYAIPAKRLSVRIMQPDSTIITAWLHGDEFVHFYVTTDNIPLIRDNNIFYYALISDDIISSSGILAHEKELRTDIETEFCKKSAADVWKWAQEQHSALSKRQWKGIPVRRNNQSLNNKYSGKYKGLVLLVDFNNMPMSIENPLQEFFMQFNQIGYSKNGHIGSVSDYFYDQSYGMFELEFDVVGPLTVSKGYEFYGQKSNGNNDKYPATMIAEACHLADEHINFSDYDWNGDGEVEQVFIIYAGYGESEGASDNTIWPHKYSLSIASEYGDGEGAILLDGVKIDTYACTCELSGYSGAMMNGMGTACHEFSHCLGLPDLYDVKYRGGVGMSYWDVMNSGSRNGPTNNGEIPCGYSAFERYLLGWIELEELNTPRHVDNMACLGDNGKAYIIYNDSYRDEFYILENRQAKGWFSYVGSTTAHGMLITHVDYNEASWERNSVNTNRNHQRMSFVPADNSYGEKYESDGVIHYNQTDSELHGDLFPGSKNIDYFTNRSHTDVGGKLFNMNSDGSYYLNKPIDNIKENNGIISFDFMGGIQIPVPEVLDADNITESSFRAVWSEIENAEKYTLEMAEVTNRELAIKNMLLNDGFTKFKAYADTAKNIKDLSRRLDEFTTLPLWKGHNIFATSEGIRIGNGYLLGYIKTPEFESKCGSLTIKLSASSANESSMNIQLESYDGNKLYIAEQDINATMSNYVITFDSIQEGSYSIKISTQKILNIGNIAIYDGIFSYEDLVFSNSQSPNIFRTTIEGITDTYYHFENLNNKNYKYRVKVHIEDFSSDWSSYMYVTLGSTLKVDNTIMPCTSNNYEYYTLQGRKINRPYLPGIYIIKGKDGVKKVYIKDNGIN